VNEVESASCGDPARLVAADRLAERRGISDVALNIGDRTRFVAEQQPQPPRIGGEVERKTSWPARTSSCTTHAPMQP
jgi:hypothetical protein